MPVFGMAGVPALWVTAERDDVGVLWRRTAEQALSITHGGAFAWLAREQLTAERSARLRSTLLTEILEHGDAIPAGVSEQAGMVGWQLSGWHVGVHLRFPTGSSVSASAFAMEALARNLSTDDLTLAALVERADGWSTWLTSIEPLPADYAHQIAARLRTGLTALATRARSTVAVGVGGPQRDVTGIATTLAEARQAAVIAESSGEPVAVRVVQDLDASRLLLGWYSSTLFHDHAVQILRPITASNDPELLTTLEAYLDHSCSTVHAARALGIHRNTVGQRISRAERLLGSSVQHPDTRLALQLALRIVRARTR
jgi:sugar diacid utilization regulator